MDWRYVTKFSGTVVLTVKRKIRIRTPETHGTRRRSKRAQKLTTHQMKVSEILNEINEPLQILNTELFQNASTSKIIQT